VSFILILMPWLNGTNRRPDSESSHFIILKLGGHNQSIFNTQIPAISGMTMKKVA
jgi:hypothetical protein